MTFRNAFIFLSLFFVLLKIITGNIIFIGFAGLVTAFSFLLSFRHINQLSIVICFFVCVYIILFGIININVEGRNYYLYIYYFLFSLSIALLIRKFNLEYKTSLFLLLLSLMWMVWQISIHGYNPDAYNNLIDGSRNYISAYLIIFYVYYMYSCFLYQKNIKLIYPALITIACVFLYGRSGIILSLVLFAISIFKIGGRYKIGFIIILLFVGLLYFHSNIYSMLLSSNLSHGVETERSVMLTQYLGSIKTAQDLIFGVDLFECCSIIRKFEGNPHNSFIMLHSRFGVFPFLLIGVFYLYQIAASILLKNIYLNLLLGLIFIRYLLDTIGFFGPIDFIIICLVISIVTDETNKAKGNNGGIYNV